jgi:hypothetical protein
MAVRSETLIVLGAGASKDFKLPLGDELKEKIRTKLDIQFPDVGQSLESGDYRIVEAYRLLAQSEPNGRDISPYLEASLKIAAAMPHCESIDDYLEKHQGNPLYEVCGKIAIARCILEAESKSTLAPKNRQPDPTKSASFTTSWMSSFMRTVTKRVTRANIASAFDKMLIVNFNYDRCFEVYVYYWLRSIYDLDHAEAADVVNKIKMIRPYGYLGPLPTITGNTGVGFGQDPSPRLLIDISNSVKTYSESNKDNLHTETIAAFLAKATKIAFLGFAFHDQNMKFFDITRPTVPLPRDVFASAYKIPQPRLTLINDSLQKCFKMEHRHLNSHSHDGNCRAFLNEYGANIFA